MRSFIVMGLFFLFLVSSAKALKIEQFESLVIHPGQFQSFFVDIISEENEETSVVLSIRSPEGIVCFFNNQNTVIVINLKPYETKKVLINTYANVNIKSQQANCFLNYVMGFDDQTLGVIKNISEKSEIKINNYSFPVGRIHPIYIVVRGNVSVPAYYTPSVIEEATTSYNTLFKMFILSWVGFIILGFIGWSYFIDLRRKIKIKDKEKGLRKNKNGKVCK